MPLETMRVIRMRAPRPACLWRLEWRWYSMTTRLQQVMCDPEADPDGDTWGPLLSQDTWGATPFSVSALEMFLNSRPRESMEYLRGLYENPSNVLMTHWRLVDADDFVTKCFWYMAPDAFGDRHPYLATLVGASQTRYIVQAARRLLASSSVSTQAWHAIVVALCCIQRFFWGNALNGTTFRPEDALFQDVQRLVNHAGTTCPHCHEQCGVSRLPCNHLRAEILRSIGTPPDAFLLWPASGGP